MLGRDVRNMTSYYGQYDASLLKTRYAEEMWQKFENGELQPTTELTGEFIGEEIDPDVDALLDDIHAVAREEEARLERLKENDEMTGY